MDLHKICLVSIPQGTIKSFFRSAFVTIPFSFQFHKVRLKGTDHVRSECVCIRVSIPQGTIKSFIHISYRRGNNVSIPQGTIKSNELGRGTASVTVFQFHKVRLKEHSVASIAALSTRFNSTRYD